MFGLGYGTAIRVGYEIVFPALFGNKEISAGDTKSLDKIEQIYTAIGGLEAHKFGINQGIKNALKEIEADSELVELIKKNLFNDTINITVNPSGTSKPDSDKDPSPSSGSKAEQLRKLKEAYAKKELEDLKEAHKIIQSLYTQAVKEIVAIRFPNGWTFGWLTTLFKSSNTTVVIPGGTFELESFPEVSVHLGFLTLDYQQQLATIFNTFNEASQEQEERQLKKLPKHNGIFTGGSLLHQQTHSGIRRTLEGFTTWSNAKKKLNEGHWKNFSNWQRMQNYIKLMFIHYDSIIKNWDRLTDA